MKTVSGMGRFPTTIKRLKNEAEQRGAANLYTTAPAGPGPLDADVSSIISSANPQNISSTIGADL